MENKRVHSLIFCAFLSILILLFIFGCSGGGSSSGGGGSNGNGGTNGTSSPNLKSVSISPNSANASSTATINFNFTFSDPEGDLGGGTAYYNDGTNQTSFALPNSLTGVKDGSGSGQINIAIGPNPGTYNVSCWLVDKGGNRSNTLTTTFTVLGSSGPTAKVRCGSEGFQYKKCFAGYGLKSVGVQKQYSIAECIKDQSWGYVSPNIWVDQGCDADFTAYF
jgi:hypothetical protein